MLVGEAGEDSWLVDCGGRERKTGRVPCCLQLPGSAEAGLDLVANEEDLVLLAQLAHLM